MDYSQYSMGSISDELSYLDSSLGMHVDRMRHENMNAGWIENSSPYNYFSCVYCGESHSYEHCPYNTAKHYMRGDFTRNQTCFDHSFYPSESFEQQESLNPYFNHYSKVITPSFHSYPYFQENVLDFKEKSDLERICEAYAESSERFCREQEEFATRIESRVQNIGVYVNQIVLSLETMKHENSLNVITTSCVTDDYCEDIEDGETNETLALVECEDELEITFSENNVCGLEEVPIIEPNSYQFDVEMDLDVSRVVVHNTPIEVLPRTDDIQVDFVGNSKFLEAPKSVCKYMPVVLHLNSVNSCTLKLSMIEEVQVIKLNDHFLCLKPSCLKRKEDKVIMVFDTYD